MKLSRIYKLIITSILSSAIIDGGILAYTQTNVDKLDLLSRVVADNTVSELAEYKKWYYCFKWLWPLRCSGWQ